MPRKISVRGAEVQQLSPALGSETVVAVAALGLEAFPAVVSVAVVVDTDRVPNVGVRGRFPVRRKQEAVIA